MRLIQAAIIVIFVFSMCNVEEPGISVVQTQQGKKTTVQQQLTYFDSLNKSYLLRGPVDTAELAARVADSIVAVGFPQHDSILQNKYLSMLLNNAVNLYDLKSYVESVKYLEQFFYYYELLKQDQPEFEYYASQLVANIYSMLGDYNKSIIQYRKSRAYYLSTKQVDYAASTAINETYALLDLGKLAEADSLLSLYLQYDEVSPRRKAFLLLGRTDIAIKQQKLPIANGYLKNAFTQINKIKDTGSRQECLAKYYLLDCKLQLESLQPDAAINAAENAIKAQRRSNLQLAESRELGKLYIHLGKSHELNGNFDMALRAYNLALHNVLSTDTNNIYYVPAQVQLYAENTIAETLDARADLLSKFFTTDTAKKKYAVAAWETAMQVDMKLLQHYSFDESTLHILENFKKRSANAIRTCFQLFKNTGNRIWAEKAFRFAESGRAVLLQKKIQQNLQMQGTLENDSAYRQMKYYKTLLVSQETELKRLTRDTGKVDALRKLRGEFEKNQGKLARLDNIVAVRYPRYRAWKDSSTDLTLADIEIKLLDKNRTLIEYFIVDSAQYLFKLDCKTGLQVYALDSTVNSLTKSFHAFFNHRSAILNNTSGFAEIAFRLYKVLFPFSLDENVDELIIIPDGNLYNLPFDALLTKETNGPDISSMPFLVKTQNISYGYSCKTLIDQQLLANASDDKILALAPVFKDHQRGLEALPASEKEVQAIQDIFPRGSYFYNEEANFRALQNAGNASVIHFSTHASAGNDSTAAVLELADTSLALASIYDLNLKSQLAVISACQTATGDYFEGEGLMSIARAFSYAGTSNTIASLWNSNDMSSAEIFKSFYSNIHTTTYSKSLQEAKLQYLNQASVQGSSPYYWANFVFIGSPKDKMQDFSFKWKWLLLLLLVPVLIVVFKKSRS